MEQKQAIYCPKKVDGKTCGEILFKISGISVGCEVDIVCRKCGNKINCRFLPEGWKRYQDLEE